MPESSDLIIIGGGTVGLSVGWRMARQGMNVTVLERDTLDKTTSQTAAGMLAPHAEAGFEEQDLMQAGLRSLNLFPGFLDELEQDSGIRVPLHYCGTMLVGLDRDDTEWLRRVYRFHQSIGLDSTWMTGTEAREREPLLSSRVISAMWLPGDAQIDNGAFYRALKQGFENRGGILHENTPVREVDVSRPEVKKVMTGQATCETGQLLIAAGSWSRQIKGIPEQTLPPVRPVKGQLIALEQQKEWPLRTMIRSPRVYLVPKPDGPLKVGASSEEKGFDMKPTAGVIRELLDEARFAVPMIEELALDHIMVGLRPAVWDHYPVAGETRIQGLYVATGHYRHGILLCPLTSQIMSAYLGGGRPEEELLEGFHSPGEQQGV